MDGDVGCDRMFSYTKDPICSILVVLEHSNKESIEVVVMIFLSPVETTCVTKKTRQDKQKYQVGNHLQHLSASFSIFQQKKTQSPRVSAQFSCQRKVAEF